MMEPIQLILSAEPPNSSWNATKKIPKLFRVPITRTFTCTDTNENIQIMTDIFSLRETFQLIIYK